MTGRLADPSVAILEWANARLAASDDLAAALGTTTGAGLLDRIWDAPPGEGATLPYIELTVAEPRDVGGVGTVEVMATVEMTAKLVDRAESYTPLRPAVKAMHEALHGRIGDPVAGGGAVLSSVRRRAMAYTENDRGVEYRHIGGTYAVNVQ